MNATLLAPPKPPCTTRLDLDFTSTDRTEQERAKAVCRSCSIRQACRDEAIRTRRFGSVRGGLDPRQLRAAARFADRKTGGAVRHGTRSCYAAGCRRPECRLANRLYIRAWRRAPRAVTSAPKLLAAVLTKPSGRGRRRAYEGQLMIEIGVGK